MAVSLVDPHGRWSYPAGAANLAQYLFVALNAAGQLILPTSQGHAIGVLDDAASLAASTQGADGEYSGGFIVGRFYGVVFRGVIKVRAGANLAPMAPVGSDASGRAVAATGVTLGITMAACNSGDLVPVNVSAA